MVLSDSSATIARPTLRRTSRSVRVCRLDRDRYGLLRALVVPQLPIGVSVNARETRGARTGWARSCGRRRSQPVGAEAVNGLRRQLLRIEVRPESPRTALESAP